jgi:hypothetical protein
LPMAGSGQPEVLPPEKPAQLLRVRRAGQLFSDENLNFIAHVLDDWFRLPGTSIRFGLDGLIGLMPGLGDILAGMASCILILGAWVRGVPYITIARMVVNVGLDVIIGAIPLLGDAFDIAWKANRRNYALLVRRLEQPRQQTWRDWAYLLLLAAALFAILVAPLFMLLWALEWLRGRL